MKNSDKQNPIDAHMNLLLAALPESEFNRILPNLQLVNLPLGKCLSESGEQMSCVYFPTTAIVSLLYNMESGSSAEIAVVGNDGVVGISLFMGGLSTPNRAIVQSSGYAFKLTEAYVKYEFNRSQVFQKFMLRYTMALFAQVSQTAACNRYHTVEQQLCRWILLHLDRLPSNELFMTHELIANMLGVRREGVTIAAEKLQKAGLISYSRGHITVLNRHGIEERVCECYESVKKEVNRLFADPIE
ncbi:MAG: Crp/Fnr family transcriptional regulator [Sphaerochaetaceae bacterium]|nr:Crp/Fnr family transcriptional regulator [Sphaerochaetaceae bacterium]